MIYKIINTYIKSRGSGTKEFHLISMMSGVHPMTQLAEDMEK